MLSLFQNLPGLRHSYLGPQPIWTIPWQDWESLFMKLHKSLFWARNLTTCWVLFHRWPISNIIFFENLLRLWHSYLGPQPIWTSPWQVWKSLFMKLHMSIFLSSKFDHVLSSFFVDYLYQILSLFQNLLGLWHSYLGPQRIWKSPWQDWKSLFMKLHKSLFWARNLTTF